MLLVPYAFNKSRPADYTDLEKVAQAGAEALKKDSGKEYTVGQASRVLYPYAGGSNDWAKAEAGIKFSYTFELRDTGEYGFTVPPGQIEDTCSEIVAAVTAMIKKSDPNPNHRIVLTISLVLAYKYIILPSFFFLILFFQNSSSLWYANLKSTCDSYERLKAGLHYAVFRACSACC